MPESPHILVVEDEADLARVLAFNLEGAGYVVSVAPTARAADAALAARRPDLILLDLRLPDRHGLEFLRTLKDRPATAVIPVIVVSALGDEQTVVTGLNLGAEDYVTKPFRVQELLARVARALRRTGPALASPLLLTAGRLRLNLETREVHAGDVPVELTRTEFALLAHFVRTPGRVFTRQQLCDQALGAGGAVMERTVDAHVRTLRRKLGDAGRHLVTVWGIGYKLSDEPVAESAGAPDRARPETVAG